MIHPELKDEILKGLPDNQPLTCSICGKVGDVALYYIGGQGYVPFCVGEHQNAHSDEGGSCPPSFNDTESGGRFPQPPPGIENCPLGRKLCDLSCDWWLHRNYCRGLTNENKSSK